MSQSIAHAIFRINSIFVLNLQYFHRIGSRMRRRKGVSTDFILPAYSKHHLFFCKLRLYQKELLYVITTSTLFVISALPLTSSVSSVLNWFFSDVLQVLSQRCISLPFLQVYLRICFVPCINPCPVRYQARS